MHGLREDGDVVLSRLEVLQSCQEGLLSCLEGLQQCLDLSQSCRSQSSRCGCISNSSHCMSCHVMQRKQQQSAAGAQAGKERQTTYARPRLPVHCGWTQAVLVPEPKIRGLMRPEQHTSEQAMIGSIHKRCCRASLTRITPINPSPCHQRSLYRSATPIVPIRNCRSSLIHLLGSVNPPYPSDRLAVRLHVGKLGAAESSQASRPLRVHYVRKGNGDIRVGFQLSSFNPGMVHALLAVSRIAEPCPPRITGVGPSRMGRRRLDAHGLGTAPAPDGVSGSPALSKAD